jgi:SAM-dependent methyltransferase
MVDYAEPIQVSDLAECIFYHKMDLPGVGVVGGAWDLRGRFDDYVDDVDLEGRTVLDVGTASGFLSFEAEKRGADVVSFDMDDKRRQDFLPYRGQPWYEDKEMYYDNLNVGYQKWKNAYWYAHRALGSNARVLYGDVYNLPAEIGQFDVIIAGAILMHLANPIIALESMSRVSADKIVVVDTIDTNSNERIAYLQSRADDPSGHFVWWVYSIGLYEEVFAMLGYDLIGVEQDFYTCLDYVDREGRPTSREVLLTTVTAQRQS